MTCTSAAARFYTFFIWTTSFPATFNSTPMSFLSLFSLMHACTQSGVHAHTHKHTFRNLWPGRQSSFINFWVWVQYSVFLDSHLRAIINAGMLAEHPDLPAQICRHHCEGRAGRRPKRPAQPTAKHPNKRHEDGNRDKEQKKANISFSHVKMLNIY